MGGETLNLPEAKSEDYGRSGYRHQSPSYNIEEIRELVFSDSAQPPLPGFAEIVQQELEVEDEKDRFRLMLEFYLPQADYSLSENPRILDLGCGTCELGSELTSYFGDENPEFDCNPASLVGVDSDRDSIDRAKEFYSDPVNVESCRSLLAPNYRFLHQDAREIGDVFDEDFDVIAAQHPHVHSDPWDEIFAESKDLIKDEGILLCTTFYERELVTVAEEVQDAGYEIQLNSETESFFPDPLEKLVRNKHILLASPETE